MPIINFLKSLYLNPRFFIGMGIGAVLFFIGYFWPFLIYFGRLTVLITVIMLLIDLWLLYRDKDGIFGIRHTPEKLSNGDENLLQIHVSSRSSISLFLEIIDELPFQFQLRDQSFRLNLRPHEQKIVQYRLRPTERGVYSFGAVNIFVESAIGFARRRYQFDNEQEVAVYPSYLQMHQYELLAISNRLQEFGLKKIRRIGHSMEFEQIRDYVSGDDYRTINWKATARRNDLMVNQFQDEKSQQIYSILDKGRVMKMPFEGMSLLDYAINASLVISNIAIKKGDKAGLLSFSDKATNMLPASRQSGQLRQIQEALYKETTDFWESDYEKLYSLIHRQISRRSLLLLYTNFETLSALHRQLPFLRRIAQRHLLVVVFFENTELKSLLEMPADTITHTYQKIIAEKFAYEKRLIVKDLLAYGIQSILTPPNMLTVNTINKYLELKARGMI